ncbi:MAG: hypothetical protein JWO35_461 [Candidatus Saccharibacteria bacterium]|nr:hypothetical protein [Candidatus Saccharibacteria bacterium]
MQNETLQSSLQHEQQRHNTVRQLLAVAALTLAASQAAGMEQVPTEHAPHLPQPQEQTVPAPQAQAVQAPARTEATYAAKQKTSTIKRTYEFFDASSTVSEELADFPENAAKVARHDAVYIDALGCSGLKLYNLKHVEVGALTAEHCSLRGINKPRISSKGGSFSIVMSEKVTGEAGRYNLDRPNKTTYTSAVLPSEYDTTHDFALMIAKGHTADEVMQSAEENMLPAQEIAALKPGDKVYVSGWPNKQDGNKTGSTRRQSFKMHVLGQGVTRTKGDEELKVLWSVVPASKDGAICSYGISGSGAFVIRGNKRRIIGPTSAFFDLTGKFDSKVGPLELKKLLKGLKLPTNSVANFEAKTHRKAAALCATAIEPTDFNDGGMEVGFVRNEDDIPGHISPETAFKNARRAFFSGAPQTVVNGVISFYNSGVPSTGGLKPAQSQHIQIERPVILHDAEHEATIVAGSTPDNPDKLALYYFLDKHLEYIDAQPLDGGSEVSFTNTSGVPAYEASADESKFGSFVDGNGLHFAQGLKTAHEYTGKHYFVHYNADGSMGAREHPLGLIPG